MGDPVGRLAGRGDVGADAVIADEAALLVEGGARRQLDDSDVVADREGDDQLGERLAAGDRRLRRGEARAGADWSVRGTCLSRSRIDMPLELVHRAADRAGEAGRDVLEAELGVGLPQPVGVRAFIFAQQQADRLLALLEREVEAFALHEGAAVDQHHHQHRRGVDRPDRGDHQRIRGHQHARRGDAHDHHIGGGGGRDRREDEGGAGHHRRGDHAQGELLAVVGVLEEVARREAQTRPKKIE